MSKRIMVRLRERTKVVVLRHWRVGQIALLRKRWHHRYIIPGTRQGGRIGATCQFGSIFNIANDNHGHLRAHLKVRVQNSGCLLPARSTKALAQEATRQHSALRIKSI